MSKRSWNSDKIVSISALIISLSTLIVFMFQTNLIRKQQYMSVYPHLEFGNFASGSLKYKFQLSNVGIGPAFIQKVEVKNGESEVFEDVIDYVNDALYESDSIIYVHASLYQGRVIKQDEDIPLIQLLDQGLLTELGYGAVEIPTNTVAGSNKLHDILNHDSLEIKVTYASVYGETWTVSNQTLSPEKH